MKPNGVLETCLYVSDLDAAQDFYARVLGLELITRHQNRHVFFRSGAGVFLVFNSAVTELEDLENQGIPPHGCEGASHVAFSIAEKSFEAWKNRLEGEGVQIESIKTWPTGGRSLYFRDPAGNSIELASPRIWGIEEAVS